MIITLMSVVGVKLLYITSRKVFCSTMFGKKSLLNNKFSGKWGMKNCGLSGQTLKTDMSYNPYIRSVKNIWKLHGIEKCYVIFSLNYWLLLY